MDHTQILIDGMRRKMRFRPFNRLKFWIISTLIVVSAGSVAWALEFLIAHRAELINRL